MEKMHQYTVVIPPEPQQMSQDYPRGVHGLLMLLQIVVGCSSLGLVADLGSYQARATLPDGDSTVSAFISFGEATALMLVAYGCLATTALLLISMLLGRPHVPSLFFMLYHVVSASLYLSCGLSVVILGYQRRYEKSYVTAGALGIVNSILYIFSTCIGLRSLNSK